MKNTCNILAISQLKILTLTVLSMLALVLAVGARDVVSANLDGSTFNSRDSYRHAQGAILRFSPREITVEAGDTFELSIEIDSGSQPVSGAQVFIDFDPDRLRVQDADTVKSGVQIQSGTTLSTVLVNSADNGSGQIDYAASKLGMPFPSGTFTVATISFDAINDTLPSGTVIDFSLSGSRETIAEFGGAAILEGLESAKVVIEEVTSQALSPTSTPVTGNGDDRPTRTPTRTSTSTPTQTPRSTPTPTSTVVPTLTPTSLPAQTATPTLTPTVSSQIDAEVALIRAINDASITAAQVVGELITLGPERAANVLTVIELKDASDIFGSLSNELASVIAVEIEANRLSTIISNMDLEKASEILDEMPGEKLNELIIVTEEGTLIELLPKISTDTFFRFPAQLLMSVLPSVEFDRIAFEIAPQADISLPPLTSTQVNPTLTRYAIPQTGDSTWTRLVENHEFVDQVLGKFDSTITNVTISIEVLPEKPPDIPDLAPKLGIYSLFRIDMENASPEDVTLVHMTIPVNKSWLESNDFHKWSVDLHRFDDVLDRWVAFPSKRVSEDEDVVTYTAVTPNLSLFAVTASSGLPEETLELANLNISPSLALMGEEIKINFGARNNGEVAKIFPVNLWIDDTIEQSKTMAIDPATTILIDFEVTRPEGTYSIRVGRIEGDFNVSSRIVPSQEITPTSTPTRMPVTTATPTPRVAPSSTPTDTPSALGTASTPTPSLTETPNGPTVSLDNVQPSGTSGFIVIVITLVVAIIGVSVVGLLVQYFRRTN